MDISTDYGVIFYIGLAVCLIAIVLSFYYRKEGSLNFRTSTYLISMFLIGLGMIVSVQLWLSIGFGIMCAGVIIFVGDHILQMIRFFRKRSQLV